MMILVPRNGTFTEQKVKTFSKLINPRPDSKQPCIGIFVSALLRKVPLPRISTSLDPTRLYY